MGGKLKATCIAQGVRQNSTSNRSLVNKLGILCRAFSKSWDTLEDSQRFNANPQCTSGKRLGGLPQEAATPQQVRPLSAVARNKLATVPLRWLWNTWRSSPKPSSLTVVKMVITGNNHSLTRSLSGGRAAPTVQGGSARESRPGTPNGSAFKPPRRNSPPGQPGPDGDHPAGAALQAPVSTDRRSRPSASIRASPASLQVR